MPVRYVSVGARDIDIVRVAQGQGRSVNQVRFLRIRHVNHFQAVLVHNKTVTELNSNCARVLERNSCDTLRLKRVVDVDDDERSAGSDVSVCASNRNVVCARKRAVRVISAVRIDCRIERAFQIVVQRVAIEQGCRAD